MGVDLGFSASESWCSLSGSGGSGSGSCHFGNDFESSGMNLGGLRVDLGALGVDLATLGGTLNPLGGDLGGLGVGRLWDGSSVLLAKTHQNLHQAFYLLCTLIDGPTGRPPAADTAKE